MIIRGGYNVYPREIEEVLYEHPAVAEAAVVGVPDDKMGEEVGAAVVLKEGKEVDADELRDFVKEQVANYKYPRRIWFLGRAAQGPDGQDPQARDRGPRGGQDRLSELGGRGPRPPVHPAAQSLRRVRGDPVVPTDPAPSVDRPCRPPAARISTSTPSTRCSTAPARSTRWPRARPSSASRPSASPITAS